MSNHYNEEMLKQKISAGLTTVKKVLDTTRNPEMAGDVHHKYTDKYLLAEFITNGACASEMTVLEMLGLKKDQLGELQNWIKEGRTVSLRYERIHNCTFDKKTTREVESPTKNVTEVSGIFSAKVTNKTVTTITEYFWNYTTTYEVFAYKGNDPSTKVTLLKREGAKTKVKTTSETTPYKKDEVYTPVDVNITWLLNTLNESKQVGFNINRSDPKCFTPRRNSDVVKALEFFQSFSRWCENVIQLLNNMFSVQQGHGLDLGSLSKSGSFVPILPLLEDVAGERKQIEGGAVASSVTEVALMSGEGAVKPLTLPQGDLESFLVEERRALEEKMSNLLKVFPGAGDGALITQAEARMVVLMRHCCEAVSVYCDCVNYLEDMLRHQLVSAIGKEVTSNDFGQYMRFHSRKLFKEEYQPRQFCFAVRRPEHYPEGTVSIEECKPDGSVSEPVMTVVRCVGEDQVPAMKFALNAAASVRFSGATYVHSYISHKFSTEAVSELSLVARARQFSGFVMLLGRIGGADLFLPEHAMIVQNKDDFKIPLMLEQIPTPKEFKDAIESLSPEQQRFAKAYRSMQLESTLFGVCIVQIKPQLEKVLNLPPDSLTKEIKLTQQLLELFIEYHIPPDLLSFQCDALEDPDEIPAVKKLDAVKEHVNAMYDVIKESKQSEIDAQKLQHEMDLAMDLPRSSEKTLFMAMQCAPRGTSMMRGGGFGAMATGGFGGMAPGGGGGMCVPSAPSPAKRHGVVQVAQPGAPPPPPPPSAPKPKLKEQHHKHCSDEPASSSISEGLIDVSSYPNMLEKRFESLDEDSCLRPTIIKTGGIWTKLHQEKLLSKPMTKSLNKDDQKKEKDRAFDLLDALTRSGALSIDDATIHVVIGATHCFDKTLMDTLVQDNVNPIEKVERSTLIVASAIHSALSANMLKNDQVSRIQAHTPQLFLE